MTAKLDNATGWYRFLLVFALLAVALLPGPGGLPQLADAPARPKPAEAPEGVEALPLAVQYALSSDLGRDNPAFHISQGDDGRWRAQNLGAGLLAEFTPAGMEVRVGAETWSLSLSGWGRGVALRAVAGAGAAVAEANRLEAAYGALTAWYVNGPLGLQQGWTLAEPPSVAGADSAPLALALTQGGSLRGRVDGDDLALADGAGVGRLRYGGLLAYDASGRALPAWFEVEGDQVLVQVDDAGAEYPVVVDPWLQVSKLTTSQGADDDFMGTSVAVSEDGGTVVVSAEGHDLGGSNRGVAYVYSRRGEWASTPLYTARLTARDGEDEDYFGTAVAISADGETIVAGAPSHNNGGDNRGAAYVYARPAGGWADATETARLTADDARDGDKLGSAVAVGSDGSTVVASAPSWNGDRGATYVYERPVGGWGDATQTARLTLGSSADGDEVGWSVALSGDGGTVVAGAPTQSQGGAEEGAAYVYERPSGGWADASQAAKLTAGDSVNYHHLGRSVAASEDGTLIVAGARGGLSSRGAVYVFERPSGGWADATQQAKLTASDAAVGDALGWSVAISSDGGTVVAGAPNQAAGGSERGAAYVYVRLPSGWADTTQTAKLTANDAALWDALGWSVAISSDGGTVVVGARNQAAGGSKRGAAYVYASPPGGWATTTETAKLTASDGQDYDMLGYALDISGDGSTVAVGVPLHSAGGDRRGAVYVYDRSADAWAATAVFGAKLTASDGLDNDQLGFDVALSEDGSTLAAGAWANAGGGDHRSAVYIYARPAGGWATTDDFTAKLTADEGLDGELLGHSVAMSGDGGTIVAGAPGILEGLPGQVYVFERPGDAWADTTETAKLPKTISANSDGFGYTVAISADGSTIAAGIDAAYVYVRPTGGWAAATQPATLTGSDGDVRVVSVAVSAGGETVVAGVPYSDIAGKDWGAAYIYVQPTSGSWVDATETAMLTASDGHDKAYLGNWVATSADGSTVIAGAPDADAGGSKRGAAYVYARSPGGWATTSAFSAKLTAGDGLDEDHLGQSVAVSADGATVVAGAPYADPGGTNRGAVYVFAMLVPPALTSGAPPSPAYVGRPYSFPFAASGYPPSTFSASGDLPPGLTLDPNTGVLSGTPTDPGRYRFTVTVSNGVSPDASVEVTIEVRAVVYLPVVLRNQ